MKAGCEVLDEVIAVLLHPPPLSLFETVMPAQPLQQSYGSAEHVLAGT